MRGLRIIALVGALLSLVTACGRNPAPSPVPPTLTIAAASSLRFALPDLVARFSRDNPDVVIETAYGSSGTLAAQVASDAPFDLFLAADESFPATLVKDGHARPGSLFRYATGRLVLWAPAGSRLDVARGLDVLRDPSISRIAIANPKTAPYGLAAEQAMKKAGILDAVKDKVVMAENISQAAQFVESGNAQVGILALSLTASTAMEQRGTGWTIPESEHAPIVQAGCIVAHAVNPDLAQRFVTFLGSEPAREILRGHGFGIPTN